MLGGCFGGGSERTTARTQARSTSVGKTTTTRARVLQIHVPRAGRPLTPFNRGDEVKALQRALRRLGLSPGEVDGIYGSRTLRAVKRFQRRHGLAADGVVGPKTASAINRALRRRAG